MKKNILVGIICLLLMGVLLFVEYIKIDNSYNISSIEYVYHDHGLRSAYNTPDYYINRIYLEKGKIIIDTKYEYALNDDSWDNLINEIDYNSFLINKSACMDGYAEDIIIKFTDNSEKVLSDECSSNDTFVSKVRIIKEVIGNEIITDALIKKKEDYFNMAYNYPIDKIETQYYEKDALISKILLTLKKEEYVIKIYGNKNTKDYYMFNGNYSLDEWKNFVEMIDKKNLYYDKEKMSYFSIYRDNYNYDLRDLYEDSDFGIKDISETIQELLGKTNYQEIIKNTKEKFESN